MTKQHCEIINTIEWLDQIGWLGRLLYRDRIKRARALLVELKGAV